MSLHWFTFGQNHVHRVNGKTWDADVVCVIEAPDAEAARIEMIAAFGLRWAFQYDREPDMRHYPTGTRFLTQPVGF
jgi:hypothetical protein